MTTTTAKTRRLKAVKYGPRFASATYTVKVRGEYGCASMRDPSSIQLQAECYLSSRPDGVVDVTYSEHCAACGGSGCYLHNRRTLAWKLCKTCNGTPEFVSDEFVATYYARSGDADGTL